MRLRVLMAILAFSQTMGAVAAEPEAVDAAIRKGVAYLYAQQEQDGRIDDLPQPDKSPAKEGEFRDPVLTTQWGGHTAMATYALLAAGENPQDPRIQRSVDWLLNADIVGVYALGMRASVWPYMPTLRHDDVVDKYEAAALRDANLLLAATQGIDAQGQPVLVNGKVKDNLGLYNYTAGEVARVDLSVSQYGVLGMWAVSEFVEVPPGYWQIVQNAWLNYQQPNGGWAYSGIPSEQYPVSASMTAAGLATLYLTQDQLPDPGAVRCNGNRTSPALDKPMALLIEHYPDLLSANPKTPFVQAGGGLYTLYGIERVGVASGLKYFGELDWYDEGANYLLRRQRPDGSWGSVRQTSFALLFLARGREPVMMNKLDYTLHPPRGKEVEGRWNQRPRDVANAVLYTSKQSERTLNWQIIDLDAGNVRDLHDAPILYISGDQPLFFNDEQKEKLRQYLLEGGMIVANPDCNNGGFKTSVIQLAGELFPKQPWDWRTLEQSHPIFTEQQFKVDNWKRRPNVLGLSNGVRELIVLLPGDLGRTWQSKDLRSEEDFQLAANLYLYAIDKNNTLYKGDTFLVEKSKAAKPKQTVTVGRLQYDGNWDPEPLGWEQLAAVMHNEHDTQLQMRTITAADLDPSTVPIVHLTGTGTIANDELVAALAEYLQSGGVLIADAAGGNSDFATSFEQRLGKSLGGAAGEDLANLLPADHALYGGKPMEVSYRPFAQSRVTGSLTRPALRGHSIDGKLAIVYSPQDLSAGLLGVPVDGINGYAPNAAQKLMATILTHMSKQ